MLLFLQMKAIAFCCGSFFFFFFGGVVESERWLVWGGPGDSTPFYNFLFFSSPSHKAFLLLG